MRPVSAPFASHLHDSSVGNGGPDFCGDDADDADIAEVEASCRRSWMKSVVMRVGVEEVDATSTGVVRRMTSCFEALQRESTVTQLPVRLQHNYGSLWRARYLPSDYHLSHTPHSPRHTPHLPLMEYAALMARECRPLAAACMHRTSSFSAERRRKTDCSTTPFCSPCWERPTSMHFDLPDIVKRPESARARTCAGGYIAPQVTLGPLSSRPSSRASSIRPLDSASGLLRR